MKNQSVITPAFVFDADVLRSRVAFMRRELGEKFELCYAVKANPFLIPDLVNEVDCFEVCSPGEYRICERLGVPPEKIVLSGVYKEESDIERIVARCGDRTVYTVESPAQFDLLGRIAEASGKKLPVCLRLSSGNQFGMDGETIEKLIAMAPRGLKILGLQLYSGTQKKPQKIAGEVETLKELTEKLKEYAAFEGSRIEYGPGFSVRYFRADPPLDESEALRAVVDSFGDAPQKTKIVLETGRFLAADCGEYFTRAVDLKRTDGVNYCIIDGGINHLNYYGQVMAMKLPYIRQTENRASEQEEPYTVCGSLCTTADVLVKNCPLRGLQVGDELVFEKVGAYSVTEGIYLFLSRDMPRIYRRSRAEGLTLLRDALPTDPFNSL